VKCRDVDGLPILRFLAQHQGKWCTHWDRADTGGGMPSIPFPADIPEKLKFGKMRML
jgi:hypothetical protein